MSNQTNDNIVERAQDMMAEYEGTDVEVAIANNLERGDLDMVRYLTEQAEAETSRQHFYNNDMIERGDEW
jgi:hypothetical protein